MRAADVFERDLQSACLHSAAVGLCAIDDAGNVAVMNAAMAAHLGVTEAKALGKPAVRVIEHIIAPFNATAWWMNAGDDSELEVEVVRKGAGLVASTRLLLRSNTLQAFNGECYKVISATDVTQLRRTRDEVATWERRWQAINAGVVISDAREIDMPIVYVNPMFEQIRMRVRSTCPSSMSTRCLSK